MIQRICLDCHRPYQGAGSRCADCKRAAWRTDNRQRHPAAKATYNDPAWRRLADEVTASAVACHWCGRTRAELAARGYSAKLTADHIEPVVLRPERALDPTNIVASCASCQARRRLPRT